MKPGAVVVDIAIDQGGCIETSHETSHADPVFVEHGVVHYAVGNMPGAVPFTSTYALTNVTLPYLAELARLGVAEAARRDPALALGFNTVAGQVTNEAVAEALGQPYVPLDRGARHRRADPRRRCAPAPDRSWVTMSSARSHASARRGETIAMTTPERGAGAVMLDDIDKAIIRELQVDGRMPYAKLGPAVGLSQAAVRQRVQRLIENSVMQVVAVTDPLRLGFSLQAMIGVRAEGDLRARSPSSSAPCPRWPTW